MAAPDHSTASAALEATAVCDFFNLLHNRWLPVRRRDGARACISPAQITDDIDGNPVVAIDWPRADFRIATLEFLIGLLATAHPPADEEAWLERWQQPPTPNELTAAFAPYAHAFNPDGDGPRFMQDFDAASGGKLEAPEALLLDTPGENTIEHNRDLMVRPDRFRRLSRASAAIALYTLQTYAPSGGRGYRTSVRGSSPLTTMVLPGGADRPLWHMLWANVPEGLPPAEHDLPRVFPWLAPMRVSPPPVGAITTPDHAHDLQCWWGTPRRIYLVCEPTTQGARCDLTGDDIAMISGCVQLQYGVNYDSATWSHPLTPYEHTKQNVWRPCRTDPAVGYRHWAALVTGDNNERPAAVVSAWHRRAMDLDATTREQARLLYAGLACKQAKLEAFVESEMPLPGSASPEAQQAIAFLTQRLIAATSVVERALTQAMPRALADMADLLWPRTEPRFYQILRDAKPAAGAPVEQPLTDIAQSWRGHLQAVALALFDEARPLTDPAVRDPARIVKDRKTLTDAMRGYRARGKALFEALLLPRPKGKAR
jgi:CRISPR system Cascade subunit CasA